MKKQQAPPSNVEVPDLLSVFVKGMRLRGGRSQESLKELLTSQLSPPRCQTAFVPATMKLGECNEIDVKVNEVPASYGDSDGYKQVERTLITNFEFHNLILKDGNQEKTTVDDAEEVGCLNCLIDDISLSFDGQWLKKHLKLPLQMAIKEIVAKKPHDPVNYLGFWLIDYRKSQENKQWQLEADQELRHYRSLIREPVLEVEEQISVKGEEEDVMRDKNFKYYETVDTIA